MAARRTSTSLRPGTRALERVRVVVERTRPDWGVGRVLKRGRTTLTVRWPDGRELRYDRDHLQFLEAAPASLGSRTRSAR